MPLWLKIWRSCSLLFCWINSLYTCDQLHRRNVPIPSLETCCYFCGNHMETRNHLYLYFWAVMKESINYGRPVLDAWLGVNFVLPAEQFAILLTGRTSYKWRHITVSRDLWICSSHHLAMVFIKAEKTNPNLSMVDKSITVLIIL